MQQESILVHHELMVPIYGSCGGPIQEHLLIRQGLQHRPHSATAQAAESDVQPCMRDLCVYVRDIWTSNDAA